MSVSVVVLKPRAPATAVASCSVVPGLDILLLLDFHLGER